LGLRFELCVEKKINSVVNNPPLYQVKEFDCRQAKVTDFPYVIVFRLFPEKNILLIISIFYTSKNPAKKYKRGN